MRCLMIGNFGTSWDGSICDEEHIAKALEEVGHEVIRFQRDTRPILSYKDDYFDFILLAQWNEYSTEFIPNLRASWPTAKIVFWVFDFQEWGQEWCERLIEQSDLYLSKRIADSKYPNWQWLSQDFAPHFLDMFPEKTNKDIDVLFTGSYLPWAEERNDTIKAVNEKFNLVIHSVNEWPKEWNLDVRPPVMDEGLPELYARAKVVLSIDHTLEAGYWSDRNAQIMACGGLVIFRYVPLSKSIFKDHIVYFDDIEDCLYRLEQLLERPQEDLDSVAEGGYRYTHEYMMVEDRVKDLITIVESIL